MDSQPVNPTDNTASTPPADNPVTPSAGSTPAQTPAPVSAAPALPVTPDAWPGAFGVYKYSKQVVKFNLTTIVVIILVTSIVGGLINWKLGTAGRIISYALDSFSTVALTLAYIAGLRKNKISIGQALQESLPLWPKMVGLAILVMLSLVVSMFLLVIPFFIVLPRLVLTNYYLVDKKLGIIEAYKASLAATKGYSLRIWGVMGVTILMSLLVITIIGIPVSIYLLIMYSAALPVLYEFINKTGPVTAAPSPVAAAGASSPPPPPVVTTPTPSPAATPATDTSPVTNPEPPTLPSDDKPKDDNGSGSAPGTTPPTPPQTPSES